VPESLRRRSSIELTWRTILKLIITAALVWVWLQIYPLILVLTVAILLAVTLNPLVQRLQQSRVLPRWAAATLVSVLIVAVIAGFLWVTWSSLSQQAQYVTDNLGDLESQLLNRLPAWVRDALDTASDGEVHSYLRPLALRLVRSAGFAAVMTALASVLTVYLLIEGGRTRDWVLAFVPQRNRDKAQQTLAACESAIFGYVAGNVATSIFATAFVFVALTILHVPAALLLALLAGVFDFVPVLGFLASGLPAVLVATTVSSTTALVVVLLYAVYHGVENYLIAPRVYGDRLRLSNLAVILAFAIGAELAGVIGALIALPIAAMYPAVERIWLREQVGEQTVREHKAIERRRAG
jgi:predicted PurR-regulated permease PerM